MKAGCTCQTSGMKRQWGFFTQKKKTLTCNVCKIRFATGFGVRDFSVTEKRLHKDNVIHCTRNSQKSWVEMSWPVNRIYRAKPAIKDHLCTGASEGSEEIKQWRGKRLFVNNGLPIQCFVCSQPSDASAYVCLSVEVNIWSCYCLSSSSSIAFEKSGQSHSRWGPRIKRIATGKHLQTMINPTPL